MALSLRRFLKITDRDMLSAYFTDRSIVLTNIAGNGKKSASPECIEEEIFRLSQGDQGRICRDFDLIQQMASDIGQRELRQVLKDRRPQLLDQFDGFKSAQGRGLLVLLTDRQGFDCALAAEHVEYET